MASCPFGGIEAEAAPGSCAVRQQETEDAMVARVLSGCQTGVDRVNSCQSTGKPHLVIDLGDERDPDRAKVARYCLGT